MYNLVYLTIIFMYLDVTRRQEYLVWLIHIFRIFIHKILKCASIYLKKINSNASKMVNGFTKMFELFLIVLDFYN